MNILDKKKALEDYCSGQRGGCDACIFAYGSGDNQACPWWGGNRVEKIETSYKRLSDTFRPEGGIPEEKPLVEGVAKVTKTWEETKAKLMPSGKDPVNHPGHYESGKFECIDVMLETQGKEAVAGFCICNAFKYLYRHQRKNGIEDVKKAQWYINKFLELAEEDA